jgi:quinol monooxygenase YgiN
MLIIAGTVRIDPARLDEARPAMAKMVAASNAEAGCLGYAYAQDLLDPGLIHISESWTGRAALKAHFESPHMGEWRAAITEVGVSERNLRLFETDEGEAV